MWSLFTHLNCFWLSWNVSDFLLYKQHFTAFFEFSMVWAKILKCVPCVVSMKQTNCFSSLYLFDFQRYKHVADVHQNLFDICKNYLHTYKNSLSKTHHPNVQNRTIVEQILDPWLAMRSNEDYNLIFHSDPWLSDNFRAPAVNWNTVVLLSTGAS